MPELDTMMDPPIEDLMAKAGSKFSLVSLASKRARQINAYYGNLRDEEGRGPTGHFIAPQVATTARKPLSIAFEEIAADKVIGVGGATGRPVPEMPELPSESEGDDDGEPSEGA